MWSGPAGELTYTVEMATVATICSLTLSGSGHHLLNRRHDFTRPFRIVSPSDDLKGSSLCRIGPPKYFNNVHTLKKGVICRSVASGDTTSSHEEGKDEDISRGTLIWRAVKLPIYSVALIPLTVGSAAAYLETGSYSAKQYLVLLAASVLIITWLNLSNDVYDFDTGADVNKKESVVNIIGSRTVTLLVACISLALGSTGLIWASVRAGNIRSMLLLASAITCGYIYQCPPFRLSYHGLGEPLCFAAFGPFATTAFYLLQSSTSNKISITGTIISASLLVGITTTLILFCSHFHQIEGDEAVGKMSPLVRLGTRTGSNVVKMAVVSLYSLLFGLGLCKALPATSILFCGITMPIGKLVFDYVERNHKDMTKIFMAKYYCVRLHTLFGAALAAGLIVARTIGENSVLKPLFR